MSRRPPVSRGKAFDYAQPKARSRAGRAGTVTTPRQRSVPKPRSSRHVTRPSKAMSLFSGLLLLIGLLAIVVWGVWSLAPEWWSLKDNQKTLFISSEKDGRNNKIGYAVFLKKSGRVHYWTLKADDTVTVVGGYGQYPLSSVQGLLHIEKKSSAYVPAAYSHALGVVVGNVQTVPAAADFSSFKQLVSSGWWQPPQTMWNLWRWYWTVSKLGAYGTVDHGEVSTSKLAAEVRTIPDGLETECSIAIVNSTTTSGLAGQLDIVLENGLFRVVKVTDSNQPVATTQISISPEAAERCQPAKVGVLSVLPLTPTVANNDTWHGLYRADLVIVLGQDVEPLLKLK